LVSATLLGVAPFAMAKTLGCHLTALCRFAESGNREARAMAAAVAQRLMSDPGIARGEKGAWGYEFDVQTRWSYYPEGEPNVIATFFVARAFLHAWIVLGDSIYLEQARRSARFMCERLLSDAGFFRYTPKSQTLVHNANLLAACLVSAVGTITGDFSQVEAAWGAAEVSRAAQKPDGSWTYGASSRLGWIDNFHTAYNLDALSVLAACGMPGADAALLRGSEYWVDRLFGEDFEPWYFAGVPGTYDIHAAATAVDVGYVLAAAGYDTEATACGVARWTRDHLVGEDDIATHYQMQGSRLDGRRFARWGDAPWFMARASEALWLTGTRDPMVSAVQREVAP
jgi:hypothetical protein